MEENILFFIAAVPLVVAAALLLMGGGFSLNPAMKEIRSAYETMAHVDAILAAKKKKEGDNP